jgi:preprotein translocase subunit SecD
MTEISGGKAQITGNFSEQEAKDLAVRINEAVTKN